MLISETASSMDTPGLIWIGEIQITKISIHRYSYSSLIDSY